MELTNRQKYKQAAIEHRECDCNRCKGEVSEGKRAEYRRKRREKQRLRED